MAEDRNKQTIRHFFAAASAKDKAGLRRCLAAEASWTVMGGGADGGHRFEGGDTVATHMIESTQAPFQPGEPKSTIATLIADGDVVMAETQGRGTRKDGRPYDNRYAWAFEMRDGKIVRIREYLDTLYASRFFGMIPDEPAG